MSKTIHYDAGTDPDRGLELGHGHPKTTVADERHDRPIAMDERGGDGGLEAEPIAPDVGPRKVPGRRNRKPRPAQLAKFPASVVRIASSGRTRRSVAIVRPGWMPGVRRDVVHHGGRLVGRTVGEVVGLAGGDEPRVENGSAEEPLVGGLQECLRIRRHAELRGG